MLRADRRVVVSHVGSLVRPPAMIPYLEKIRDKEPYDEAAFEKCLTDSVAEAVRLQVEAGIDVVSDGEYGKSVNWGPRDYAVSHSSGEITGGRDETGGRLREATVASVEWLNPSGRCMSPDTACRGARGIGRAHA